MFCPVRWAELLLFVVESGGIEEGGMEVIVHGDSDAQARVTMRLNREDHTKHITWPQSTADVIYFSSTQQVHSIPDPASASVPPTPT